MTRARTLVMTLVGVVTVGLALANSATLRLVYNATDSAPRGFYWITPAARLAVGDVIVARLPTGIALFAERRGYLPRTVPVLKRVAATQGHLVCYRNGRLYVNGTAVAQPLEEDASHRPLTPWRHCRALVAGEVFLLNSGNPASFDSRYFGPIDASFVRGRATPW